VRYVTGVGTKSQKLRRVTKSVRQYWRAVSMN
jgi:hypothetical protein